MVFFNLMRDYHLHTSYCRHAYGEMSDFIESAIENGMVEICFTDHIPLPDGFDSSHRMAMEDMEKYVGQLRKLRQMYPEISILIGIEADYIEGYEKFIEEFTSLYSLDLVIMSVHFIKDWPNNQWVFSFSYTEETLPKIYHEYFTAMYRGIKTGLFDVVGHMDLIKRPNHPVLETNREDIEMILDAVHRQKMSIEINTSGLRKTIAETFPAPGIVEMAVKRGITMTLGSDSHIPPQVGFQFEDVLRETGKFPGLKLARYQKRKVAGVEMPVFMG
ncbi:MAG: histidinol-phosphatase HisJ [Candidatus Aminicenantes bacterium]|nr:histidinol-phosphatase HisJ [Candidatus Aminicenantes bacterium]